MTAEEFLSGATRGFVVARAGGLLLRGMVRVRIFEGLLECRSANDSEEQAT
jgi:hypothetical protein